MHANKFLKILFGDWWRWRGRGAKKVVGGVVVGRTSTLSTTAFPNKRPTCGEDLQKNFKGMS